MLNEERPLLAKRWPEMAAKIQKRLLGEGKITKEMIESYVDAYAGIYGDDTDAYVEEIVADTYAGINRTDYGTNKLRADVKMEVGQWQKKTGSARAPPVKMSAAKDQTTKNYQGVNLAEDGSVYTYDFLTSLPDMDVTMLPEVDAVRGADNRVDTAKVVQEGMKNARAVGTERDGKIFVRNQYTGKLLMVTTNSIRHGINGAANRVLTNARLGAVVGDIVQNAVPINALYNTAKDVTGTYAMAGYATDSAGREFAAIITVEQKTGKIAAVEAYDMLHAVSGRQKKGSQADTKSQSIHSIKATKISISDLLRIVNSTHQSILPEDVLQKFGEQRNPQVDYTGKVKFSSQDGRYRDLMGEKAAKYTKGILCAYRKIKKSLSKTGEGFLYRCTIIPITPFTKTMRSDKDTSGTPETIRTSDPSLRSRPDTMKPGATQCKKILGNTRFFTVSNPIWYHAS